MEHDLGQRAQWKLKIKTKNKKKVNIKGEHKGNGHTGLFNRTT